MDPCGTPVFTGSFSDNLPLNIVHWLLPVDYVRCIYTTGGNAGDNHLAICEDVELCDMMCTAIFLAELSRQQHNSPEFSMIGGVEIVYNFLEDLRL